jgi:hypothetical protein
MFGCLGVFAGACGPGSRSIFDKMNVAACSGDADKFFVYVAEDKLADNAMKRTASEQTAAASALFGAEGMRTLARAVLNGWRKDITEKGKDGDVCGWSYVSAEKIGDGERAEVQSKAGNKKYLYFGKIDGQWKLVDFQAVDGTSPSTASANAASPPPTSPAPTASARVAPSALAFCQTLAGEGLALNCGVKAGAIEEAEFDFPATPHKQGQVLHPDSADAYQRVADAFEKKELGYGSPKARIFVVWNVSEPADARTKIKTAVDAL